MRVGERCWGHPYHPCHRSCHWLLQRIGRFNTRQRVICPSTTCVHPPWSGPLNGFISGTHFYCVCSNWSTADISVPERRAWASIVASAQNPPSFYQWLPKTIWHNDGDDDEEEESVNQQTLIVESGCCCWYTLGSKWGKFLSQTPQTGIPGIHHSNSTQSVKKNAKNMFA